MTFWYLYWFQIYKKQQDSALVSMVYDYSNKRSSCILQISLSEEVCRLINVISIWKGDLAALKQLSALVKKPFCS